MYKRQVVDIEEERINNKNQEYYVLNPVYAKNTIIKTPVNNQKVMIRNLITRADVDSLINDIPNNEVLWIEDEKSRNNEFKSMVKTGKCEELIKVVRSIYMNKRKKTLKGKKIYKGDEVIMQTAEKLLNEEFATILDITPEEVPLYIKHHVPNEQIS